MKRGSEKPDRRTDTARRCPMLEPHEKVWLDNYLDRLTKAPANLLKRLVVYGSKARGDAGPASDIDVLVLVGDAPDAAREAQGLAYSRDDPDSVNHSVEVHTEAEWRWGLERELPFPRNVEAEGIQIYPANDAACRPTGERPAVTRKGIEHAVPAWLRSAGRHLGQAALEVEELDRGRLTYPERVVRPAFDAIFVSAMAWCLVRGLSVVRRRDLPTTIKEELIDHGALEPRWEEDVRTVWSAWKAEIEWEPDNAQPKPTAEDANRWAETAREFCERAREAIAASGVIIETRVERKTNTEDGAEP